MSPTLLLARVLLVDDDSTTNYLNKLLLTTTMKVADQVLIAENGQQALAILEQTCTPDAATTCPELVLLDMNMPVMNGREFLELYAQLPWPRRQATKVVMLTTSLHAHDQLLAQQLPIADFVSKPLTRAKMTDLLARHFST
ncbi:MAG: response regulator, partial [Hymenobacter sp.]